MNQELIAILAQILAANARVVAMQTANAQVNGAQLQYRDDHFWNEAHALEHMAGVARSVP